MKVTAVLLLAIGIVVAVSCQKPPKPCCGPKQCMAGVGCTVGSVPTGGAQGFYTYQYGAFDYTKREFGYDVVVTYPNGTTINFRLIQKYAQGSQWLILDEYKYCLKQAAQQPEPMLCIPDTARYVTSSMMGGPGSSVSVDTWTFDFQRPHDPIGGMEGNVSLNVVSGKCYQVSSAFIGSYFDGPTEVPMVISSVTMNMTLGIPEPDKWFTLPSYCTQQDKQSRSRRSVPELNLFSIPRF